MYYEALTASDLANVTALNEEYLRAATRPVGPGEPEATIWALGHTQRAWLARTPMLLFSIRERDLERWSGVAEIGRCPDLFERHGTAEQQLAAAAGAFAWQLAQTKSYPLRLLFDASTQWIDLIASARFLDVVKFARSSLDLLVLREKEDRAFWDRLLGPGVSRQPEIRRAARVSALQSLYTRPRHVEQGRAWPAAACATVAPRLRVADASGIARRQRNRKSE